MTEKLAIFVLAVLTIILLALASKESKNHEK
jgi:hypothetical protein